MAVYPHWWREVMVVGWVSENLKPFLLKETKDNKRRLLKIIFPVGYLKKHLIILFPFH